MIIVDSNNIAYIAYFSLGELSEGEVRTGTVFGFLNIVNRIAGQFGTSFVFCFDSKKNMRKEVDGLYKRNRHKDLDAQQFHELNEMHRQMRDLRREVLPKMGFKNVKVKKGYEADDLIAHYALKYKDDHHITIVSTDKDLYQLLDSNVDIYNPRTKKKFTLQDFENKYKISPNDWPLVKAIAGDTSDNIKGVWKVGEKTAIKYIKHNLSHTAKTYASIKEDWENVMLNMNLIELPYLGGRGIKFGYKKNEFTAEKFLAVFDRLRFIHYLREEQFEKWQKNFKLKKEKRNEKITRRSRQTVFRNDFEGRPIKKGLRKLSGKR